MHVSDEQARLIGYVTAEFVRRRQLCGQPVPERVRHLHRAVVSARGTAEQVQQPDSEVGDLIDAEAAADILRCTTRNVRRIAADLDGHQVAGRWIFHRHNVIQYAEAKGAQHG